MSLIFYTNPMSRGRIVRWMLEETAAPYETVVLDYGTTMKAADYLAINPMGKVPAIKHDDLVVTECAAICAYLADAFPAAGLAPASLSERAAYLRWMFFAAGPVEQASTNRAMSVEVPAGKEAMVGYGSLATVVDVLEGLLRQAPYVAGDRFTAADVYVGSHIAWGSQFGWLESKPAFTDYLARVLSRPAYARAKEKDDALMPQQPA